LLDAASLSSEHALQIARFCWSVGFEDETRMFVNLVLKQPIDDAETAYTIGLIELESCSEAIAMFQLGAALKENALYSQMCDLMIAFHTNDGDSILPLFKSIDEHLVLESDRDLLIPDICYASTLYGNYGYALGILKYCGLINYATITYWIDFLANAGEWSQIESILSSKSSEWMNYGVPSVSSLYNAALAYWHSSSYDSVKTYASKSLSLEFTDHASALLLRTHVKQKDIFSALTIADERLNAGFNDEMTVKLAKRRRF
jgi:hypothetical protein